jgi:hypothetical protein
MDGATSEVLAGFARAMERREAPGLGRGRDATKSLAMHGLDRWGIGGIRVQEVHVRASVEDMSSIQLDIALDVDPTRKGTVSLTFVAESGEAIAGAVSAPMAFDREHVSCRMDPLPLRDGIYFPVVTVRSDQGSVLDRWKLDRAVVIDRSTADADATAFGIVELTAEWS